LLHFLSFSLHHHYIDDMHFSTAFVLAALPFLALAAPVEESVSKRGVTTVPISRRAHTMKRADGVANIEWLKQHKTHVTG
jgi:hypothetical protein